jgi:hypothetical protein
MSLKNLTGNALGLLCTEQPVNALWGERKLFIVRTISNSHSVGKMQSWEAEASEHIVITGL